MASGDYRWVDDGMGGVNYFVGDVPINREQFAVGTGQDVGAIENWVSTQYAQNNPPIDGNIGAAVGAIASQPAFGTTPQQSAPVHTADELERALQDYNTKKKQFERAHAEGLLSYDEAQRGINQSREDIVKQRDQGYQNNETFFNAVSPNAFQSQIGNYNQKVLDAYTKSDETINRNQQKVDLYKNNWLAGEAEKEASLDQNYNDWKNQTGAYAPTQTASTPTAQDYYNSGLESYNLGYNAPSAVAPVGSGVNNTGYYSSQTQPNSWSFLTEQEKKQYPAYIMQNGFTY